MGLRLFLGKCHSSEGTEFKLARAKYIGNHHSHSRVAAMPMAASIMPDDMAMVTQAASLLEWSALYVPQQQLQIRDSAYGDAMGQHLSLALQTLLQRAYVSSLSLSLLMTTACLFVLDRSINVLMLSL